MKTKLKRLSDGRIRVRVTATADETTRAINVAMHQFMQGAGMQVPIDQDESARAALLGMLQKPAMVESYKSAVMQALGPLAITDIDVLPGGEPEFETEETPSDGQPFSFTMVYVEKPRIQLTRFDEVRVTVQAPGVVRDEEIDQQIELLRQRAAQAAAASGDADGATEALELPEVTDEWVASLNAGFKAQTVEELRAELLQAGTDYYKQNFEQEKQARVIGTWAARLAEPIPAAAVEEFVKSMERQNAQQAMRLGTTVDAMIAQAGLTADEYRESLRMQAQVNVANVVALDALARHLGIRPTEKDYQRAAGMIDPNNPPQQVVLELKRSGREYMLKEAAERMLASDWAMGHAKIAVIPFGLDPTLFDENGRFTFSQDMFKAVDALKEELKEAEKAADEGDSVSASDGESASADMVAQAPAQAADDAGVDGASE